MMELSVFEFLTINKYVGPDLAILVFGSKNPKDLNRIANVPYARGRRTDFDNLRLSKFCIFYDDFVYL
jgi:hypothetical protein